MATYAFETITAQQALAITAIDTLTFPLLARANQVTVIYNASGTITLESGGRSVEFGAALSGVSQARRLAFNGDDALLVGDGGENTLSGEAGFATDDGLYGGAGADRLTGQGGNDLLQGNAGADTLEGGFGSDVIYGGQDNDVIVTHGGGLFAQGGFDFAQGNRGDDSILSQVARCTLLGGQGNDTIDGVGYLNGNLGDDSLYGRNGSDTILGEAGNDRIGVDGGVQVVDGGDGDDVVVADKAETMLGGLGNDTLTSNTGGASVVRGGDGDDLLRGRARLMGEDGNDTIQGGGATILDGGVGNDWIEGLSGDFGGPETLFGRTGEDTLTGFKGIDVLAGGDGADVFRYSQPGEAPVFSGDTITGLEQIAGWAAEDRLQVFGALQQDGSRTSIAGSSANYTELTAADRASATAAAFAALDSGRSFVAVQVGADVIVFMNRNASSALADAVILVGRTLADIGPDNFV